MSDTATAPTVKETAAQKEKRLAYAKGLRALAFFITETPGAPLPPSPFACHYDDADEFDAVADLLGVEVYSHGGPYEHVERKFGPIRYGAQTSGRAAQQIKRREEALAQRERELGLSSEDVAA